VFACFLWFDVTFLCGGSCLVVFVILVHVVPRLLEYPDFSCGYSGRESDGYQAGDAGLILGSIGIALGCLCGFSGFDDGEGEVFARRVVAQVGGH
jgi:hypothetical protein